MIQSETRGSPENSGRNTQNMLYPREVFEKLKSRNRFPVFVHLRWFWLFPFLFPVQSTFYSYQNKRVISIIRFENPDEIENNCRFVWWSDPRAYIKYELQLLPCNKMKNCKLLNYFINRFDLFCFIDVRENW